ncbi:LamG-like jellyroll fold domain-containing protein, partial [Micromonospora sonneratiae]
GATMPAGPPATAQERHTEPTRVRSDEASARATARASGQRVEVASLATQTRQVYAQPDGRMLLRQHARPVQVRQGDRWVPVDTTLRVRPDGRVAPIAATVDVSFSGGGSGALVNLGQGDKRLALEWVGALPAPTLIGDTAIYHDVLPGVDLRLTADSQGFSEVLVVKTPQAAMSSRLRPLRFPTSGAGLSVRTDRAGNIDVVDQNGTVVFHGPTPVMWDSSAAPGATATERTSAAAPGAGARQAAMAVRADATGLVLEPDAKMLADPATRYPVYVDPYLYHAGNRTAWTHVSKHFSGTSYFNNSGAAKVGYYNDPYSSPSSDTYRSFFRMDTAPVNGKKIYRATFNAFETWSYSCTKREVQLWLTGGISAATTWKNQPAWTRQLAAVTAAKGWGTNCPAGGLDLDATDAVREAAEKNWASTTLGLRAASEADTNGWKKFRNNPVLEIEYNSVPDVPASLKIYPAYGCGDTAADAPQIGTVQPRLLANLTDGDSATQTVSARYELWTGGVRLWEYVTPAKKAGGFETSTPALQNGTTYQWRVRAEDGVDVSGWSGWCHFAVDVTAPSAVPTVTSPDYPEADPNNPVLSGGVGRPGTFTFGANGQTGIVAYRYAVDDSDPRDSVAATGADRTATVSLTPGPSESWLRTLYVRGVDNAGNAGPLRAYDFYVAPAAPPAGQWAFDEGTGATAADSSGNGHTATLSGGVGWVTGRLADSTTADWQMLADRTTTFDGSAGHAATAGPVVDTATSFTVAAWVRLRDDSVNATVLSQAGNQASGFQLHYSGFLKKWVFDRHVADVPNAAVAWVAADRAPQVGRWTHLAGVYDHSARQLRFHVNGALVGTTAYTSAWHANGPLQIGRLKFNAMFVEHWPGEIDDVRIWDRVVYPGEIADVANRPAAGFGHWAMDESTGTELVDGSGHGRPLTLSGGAGWTADHQGVPGQAIALDGSGQYAASTGQVVETDRSFSVAARVRLARSAQAVVLCQAGNRACGFTLYYSTSYQRWIFNMTNADMDKPTYLRAMASTPPRDPVVDRWVHLVGVHDAAAGQLRLYVDGELAGTAANPAAWHAPGPLQVGRSKVGGVFGEHFPGDVADVRIYTGVLSQYEIDNLRFQ